MKGVDLTQEDRKLLQGIVEIMEEMKGEEIMALDLRKLTAMTDYFIIAHGTSTRHVQSMAHEVENRVKSRLDRRPHHVEGTTAAEWVLLDYSDVIVHIFLDERRKKYGLETIWMDAPRMDLSAAEAGGD